MGQGVGGRGAPPVSLLLRGVSCCVCSGGSWRGRPGVQAGGPAPSDVSPCSGDIGAQEWLRSLRNRGGVTRPGVHVTAGP